VRVADAVPRRYRALVYLLAYGGLRIGEAAALKVERLNLVGARVEVVEAYSEVGGKLYLGETKSEATRSVTLPATVRYELASHLEEFPPEPSGLVFTSSRRRPVSRSTFRQRVGLPAVKSAPLAAPRPRVHDLRHTSVALAIAAGAHPKAIQARAGHSSIIVTMNTFGHLFPGQDEALAERVDAMARGDMVEI
jgi:integrase